VYLFSNRDQYTTLLDTYENLAPAAATAAAQGFIGFPFPFVPNS
jgi:hypothetical protein